MNRTGPTTSPAVEPSSRKDTCLRFAIEAVVLAIVVAAPWPNAADSPFARLYLSVALSTVLLLWAVRLVLFRSLSRRGNGPFWCLAGFVLLSELQLAPLPESVATPVSPGVSDMRAFDLPGEHERLPGEAAAAVPRDWLLTISRGDTLDFLTGALAVCVFYGAVLHNTASAAAFRRLAWACAINGVLISLLAFALRISHERVLFWDPVPRGGADYGPFESRNTFPFVVNVCVGLAAGLMAARAQKSRAFLHDGPLLWLFAAVALMATAVAFSLSRGGVLSLLVAVACAGVVAIRLARPGAALAKLLWLIPVVIVVAGVTFWSALEGRFESLVQSRHDFRARYDVWRDSLKHFADNPVFGVGNGSFRVVEPVTRTAVGGDEYFDNAHNEYVEALVEGGLIRLALTLGLVAAVTIAGLRNSRRFAGRSLGWLVLGGLAGLWAVVFHSFVDFGVHYPAVALLAAAVAAHVSGTRLEGPDSSYRVPAPLALLLALGMVGIGAAFVRAGIRDERAYRHFEAGMREADDPSEEAARRSVAQLEAAVRLRPASHVYHYELASAYSRLAAKESAEWQRAAAWEARAARDLCPCYAFAHSRLALVRDSFAEAPPALWYLERAVRSDPTNPSFWYASGKRRFDDGDTDGAGRDWRRTLELRGDYIDLIAPLALTRMSPATFIEKVLPDKPEVIYAFVNRVVRDIGVPVQLAAPFLQRALVLLERRGSDATAAEELLHGRVLQDLGRREESAAAFRRALALDSNLMAARVGLSRELFELAREADDKGLFLDAKKETAALLSRDPHNAEARDRAAVIDRELLLLE